jgi:hypothetical protein
MVAEDRIYACRICGQATRNSMLCPAHQIEAASFSHHLRKLSKVEYISTAALMVDPNFQRPLSERRVAEIVLKFNELDLGFLTVSRRARENVLLDGQHRWTALLRMGYAEAPCEVLEGLTREQEIMIFVIRNEERTQVRRSLLFTDKAKAGIEPYSTAVEILGQHGYELIDVGKGATVKANQLFCPRTIEIVHRMGKLSATLFTIRRAWPELAQANRAEMLQGVATFLQIYPQVEAMDLADRLGRFPPERLVQQARQMAKGAIERRLWVHMYEQIVQAYNYAKIKRVPRVDISPRAPNMWIR